MPGKKHLFYEKLHIRFFIFIFFTFRSIANSRKRRTIAEKLQRKIHGITNIKQLHRYYVNPSKTPLFELTSVKDDGSNYKYTIFSANL